MKNERLTEAEAKRLRTHCKKNGGRTVVAVGWGMSLARIDRAIARIHAPQKDFRQKLVEVGVIKP